MLFAELPIDAALGKISAHTLRLESGVIKKGTVLIQQDLDALRAARIANIYVAAAEPGELSEDDAVRRVAAAVAGTAIDVAPPAQGRCNLYAACDGILRYDPDRIGRINDAERMLNVLAVRAGEIVRARQLIGQVKAIPYLVSETAVDAICGLAAAPGPLFAIDAFRPVRVGLVQTILPGTRGNVLDKTRAVLEGKLQLWQADLGPEQRCAHARPAVAEALADLFTHDCELILIVGASASTDTRDVVPAAITELGGRIVQLGVPLEPGTLLSLAYAANGTPILVLPGSLRSPVASSFDVIAPSLLAGWRPTAEDLRELGAGGLLKAVPDEQTDRKRHRPGTGVRIGAVVLAAGLSRRMGSVNKLLAEVDGRPLIRGALVPLIELKLDPIVVVVGHDAARLRATLEQDPVTIIENPDYGEGISSSLRAGIDALNHKVDAALICLGDMPYLRTQDIERIITAYGDGGTPRICVPVHDTQQGNPVLWSRDYFGAIRLLRGDHGAKRLLAAYAEAVVPVAMDTPAVLRDIDTPAQLPDPSAT